MKRNNNLIQIWQRIPRIMVKGIARSRTEMLFFLGMCYTIAIIGNLSDVYSDLFLSFLLPIFDCFLICLGIHWLKRIHLGWLLTVPITLLLVGELFLLFFYRSYYTLHVVQLLTETNSQESSEFLRSALTQPSLWLAIGIATCIALLSWMLNLLSRKPFRMRSLLIFFVFLLVFWSGLRQLSAYKKLTHCFCFVSISECGKPENIPHLNTPFVRFLYGVAYNMASSAELRVLEESVKATIVKSCEFRCPLIILVIGESYNKYHTPLYQQNYLPTTPRLSQLQADGELFVHTDAVSPFNLTSNVFKYMFSTWDESDDDEWTQHTLFPALFKTAGYRVLFYTNQFTTNSDDLWNVVGGTIFNRPSLSDLQFTQRNEKTYTYDGELLQELPSLTELTTAPTLLIVHLIGQHVRYAERFPKEYAHFTAEDARTTFGGKTGKQMMADYDNATYYNDDVVGSLLERFQETNAIGIYLSDHGEEVYDWRDQYERTNEADISPEIARYQYEIPLLFYLSKRFQVMHEEITRQVQDCLEKPFISSDISHILLYLGGIQCADYEERKNILSPQYDIHRKRILRNQVDYDELMKSSAYAITQH